jgi:hypothetical protein
MRQADNSSIHKTHSTCAAADMKTLSKVSLPPTAEEQALLDELREYKAQRDALLAQRDQLLGALAAKRLKK